MTRNQITLSGEIKEEYQTEAEEAKAGIYPNNEELSLLRSCQARHQVWHQVLQTAKFCIDCKLGSGLGRYTAGRASSIFNLTDGSQCWEFRPFDHRIAIVLHRDSEAPVVTRHVTQFVTVWSAQEDLSHISVHRDIHLTNCATNGDKRDKNIDI